MEQHKQTMGKDKGSPQKTPPKNTTEERPKEPPSPAAKLLTRRALAGKGSKKKGKGKTKTPELNVSSAKPSNSSANLTFGLTDSTLSDSGYQKITQNPDWWQDLGKSLQNVTLSKLISAEGEDSMNMTEDSLQFPTPVHKKPRRAVKRVSASQFHGVMDVTQVSDRSTRSSTLSVTPEVVSEDTDQSDSSTEMPVTRRKRLARKISKGVFIEAVGSSSMRVSKSPRQSIDPQLEIEKDVRHSIDSPPVSDIAMKSRRNIKKVSMSAFKSAAEEVVDLDREIQEPDIMIEQEQTDSDAEASPVVETSQKRRRVKRVSSGKFVAEMETLNTSDSTKSKANSSSETHDDKVSDSDIPEVVESTSAKKRRVKPVVADSFTTAMNNSESSIKNQTDNASFEAAPPENTSLQDMTIDTPPINRSKSRVQSVTAESFSVALNNSESSVKNLSVHTSLETAPENTPLQDISVDSPPINQSKRRIKSVPAESFTATLNDSESSVKNQSAHTSLEGTSSRNTSLQDMTIESPLINQSKSRVQSVTAESFTAALNDSENSVKNQSAHTSLERASSRNTSLQDMTIDSPLINRSKSRVQSVTAESFTAALNDLENSIKNKSAHTSLEGASSRNTSLQDMTIDSPLINRSKSRVQSVTAESFTAALNDSENSVKNQSAHTSLEQASSRNTSLQDMSVDSPPINRSKSRVQSVTAESFTAALNDSENSVKNQSAHTSLEGASSRNTSLQDMTIDSPSINRSKSRVQSVTAESFSAALNDSENSVKNQSTHTSLETTPENTSLQDMSVDSPPINQGKRRVESTVDMSALAETDMQVINEQQSQNTPIVHPVTQSNEQIQQLQDMSIEMSPALSKTSSGSANTTKQSIADSRDSSSPVVVAKSSKAKRSKAKRGVKPVTVEMFGELMDESLGSNKSLQLTLPVSQSSDQSNSSKRTSSTKIQSEGSQENQDMTKSKTSFSPVVDQKSLGKKRRVRPVSMGRFASSLDTTETSDAANDFSPGIDKINRTFTAHEASSSSVDSVPSPEKVPSKRQRKKISSGVYEQAIADKTFTVSNPETVNSSPAKSTRKSMKDNVSHDSDENNRSIAQEASNSSVDSVLSPEKVPQRKQKKKVSIGTFERAIDQTFIMNNPEIADIANSSPAKSTRKSMKDNVLHDKDKSFTGDHDDSEDSIPSPEMVPQRRVKKKISIGTFEQEIADKTFVINSSDTEDNVNAKSTRKSGKSMSTSIHQKSMATIHEGLELVEEVTYQDSAKNSPESLSAFAKGSIVRHSFSPSFKTQTRAATMISKTLDETTASLEEQTEGTSTSSTKSPMSSGATSTRNSLVAFRKGGPVRHSFSPLMSPANTAHASLDDGLSKVDTPTPQRVTRKSSTAFQRHGPVRHSDSFSQPLPPMESSSNIRDSSYMYTSTQAAESTDSQLTVGRSSIMDHTADINTSKHSSVVLDESNVNSSLGSVGAASPKLASNKKRVKEVNLSFIQQFMETESDEDSMSKVSEVSDQNLQTATTNKSDLGNASKRDSKSTQDKSAEMSEPNNSRVSTRRSNTNITNIFPENTFNVSKKELSMSDKRMSIESSGTETNNSRLSVGKLSANLSRLMSEQTINISQRETMASEKMTSAASSKTEFNSLRMSLRKSAANSFQSVFEQSLDISQKESSGKEKRRSTEPVVTEKSRTSARKSAANSSQSVFEQSLDISQKESSGKEKRRSTEPVVTEKSRTSPRKSAANSSQSVFEQSLDISQKESSGKEKRRSTEPVVTEKSRTSPRKSAANSSQSVFEQSLDISQKESSGKGKRKSTEPAVTEKSRTSTRKSAANSSQSVFEHSLDISQKEPSISNKRKSTGSSETEINSSRLSTKKSIANSSQLISESTANTSQRESSNGRKTRSVELYDEIELESESGNSTMSKESRINQEREVTTEEVSNEKATPLSEANEDSKLEFTPLEFDLALNTMKINAISVTKNLFDVSMSESSDRYSASDFQKAFEMIDSPYISMDTSSAFEESTMLQHGKSGDASTASLSTNTSVTQTRVVESPSKNIRLSALKLSETRLSRTLQQKNTPYKNKSLFSVASSTSTVQKSYGRKRYTLVDLQSAMKSVRSPSDSLNSPSNFSSKSDLKFSIRDFEKALTTLKQNTTLNVSGLTSSSLRSSLGQQQSRREDQTMRESLASTGRQSSSSTEPHLSLEASVFPPEQTVEGDATMIENHDKTMSNAETTLGNVSHASSLDISNDGGVFKAAKKNFVKPVSLSGFKNQLNDTFDETQGPSENISLDDSNATSVVNQDEGGLNSKNTQETSTRKSKRLSLRASSRPSSNNTNVTEASLVSAKSRSSTTSVNTASHILTLDASSSFFQSTDTTEPLPSRKTDETNISGDNTNTETTSRNSGATVVSVNSPKSSNTIIEPTNDTVVSAKSSQGSKNSITPKHTDPKSIVSATFDDILPESSAVSVTSPPDDSSESSQDKGDTQIAASDKESSPEEEDSKAAESDEEEDTQGSKSDKKSSHEEEDSETAESDKESSHEEEETQVAVSDKESSHEEEDSETAGSDKEGSGGEEETPVAASVKESSHQEEDAELDKESFDGEKETQVAASVKESSPEEEDSEAAESDEEEDTQGAKSDKESSHEEEDSDAAESDKESSHDLADEESAHSDISESAELPTTESGHLADNSASINDTPQANFSGIYPTSSSKASEKSVFSVESTAVSGARRDLTQAFSTANRVSAQQAADTSGPQNQRDQPVNWMDYRKMLDKQPIEVTRKRPQSQNTVVPSKKARVPKRSIPVERMVDGATFKLPRRKKCKPWITSKLCKKLETQFAKKDSLSAGRITEDFIDWLSDKVTKAIKSQSDSHKLAKQIAKTLKKHEFIENDYDFCLFCNEFLPQAFCAKNFTYPRKKFIE